MISVVDANTYLVNTRHIVYRGKHNYRYNKLPEGHEWRRSADYFFEIAVVASSTELREMINSAAVSLSNNLSSIVETYGLAKVIVRSEDEYRGFIVSSYGDLLGISMCVQIAVPVHSEIGVEAVLSQLKHTVLTDSVYQSVHAAGLLLSLSNVLVVKTPTTINALKHDIASYRDKCKHELADWLAFWDSTGYNTTVLSVQDNSIYHTVESKNSITRISSHLWHKPLQYKECQVILFD